MIFDKISPKVKWFLHQCLLVFLVPIVAFFFFKITGHPFRWDIPFIGVISVGETVTQEILLLNNKVAKLTETIEELEANARILLRELEEAQADKNTAQQLLSKAEKKAPQLETSNKSLVEALAKEQQRFKETSEELIQARVQVKNLDSKLNSAQAHSAQLQNDLADALKKLDEFRPAAERLTQALEELETAKAHNADLLQQLDNAKQRLKELEALTAPPPPPAGSKVGTTVTFGHYVHEPDKPLREEPIEWRVIDEKDGKYLLLSECGLEFKRFHHQCKGTSWERCDLRQWLNGDFYKKAFRPEDQARIVTVVNQNPRNTKFNTRGGPDTTDKVFLFSLDEAQRYFTDSNRSCQPTNYARAQSPTGVNCSWWLRTPGRHAGDYTHVKEDGTIDLVGYRADGMGPAVRPAVWVSSL